MRVLILGATGLVGKQTLELALADSAFSEVVAPTRKPLAGAEKLINPVAPSLEDTLPFLISSKPDAVICALGTTQAKAGSKDAFRYVDYELPITFGKALHAVGVETYAIVSAMGASPTSKSFYYRTKGDVEQDIQRIGFRSLIICKPSLIAGERSEARWGEAAILVLLKALGPILPKRLRANPAHKIASALLSAVIAPKAGCHTIDSEEMI